jgi:hypothetical protein
MRVGILMVLLFILQGLDVTIKEEGERNEADNCRIIGKATQPPQAPMTLDSSKT